MPSFDIRGKVFFITGGAQGYGKAIARGVLERGAKVFFVDILKEKSERTLHELRERFGSSNVAFSQIDVVNRKDFEAAFLEATREFGEVDVLLNNAAIVDEINTRRMAEVNFIAVIQATEVATALMRRDRGGRGGRIIAMSSIAGLDYFYQLPVYNAAKHAIRVYSKALSQNPDIETTGLEFASFHSDASEVGIFPKITEGDKGIQDAEELFDRYRGKLMTMEYVVEAFIDLVSLDKMNGADLFVSKDRKTFVEVQKHELGEKFPPGE